MTREEDTFGAGIRGMGEHVPEGARTEAAKKALEELRLKLLDLKNSNKLLNFRHSERARTHVRIIDELPDQLMAKLLEGSTLTFRSLPEPEDEPADEHDDAFLMALESARASDEAYLQGIRKVDDGDPDSAEARKIERELKDRVRARRGMPPRPDVETMSIAEYARLHGLDPSYDMPRPGSDVEDKHDDNEMQTLLLPDAMERKLSGLTQGARTTLQETGVNTLYVAFGFLEWYERHDSEVKHQAPLLLHPTEIERTLQRSVYRYDICSSGEETEVNLTLGERLKRDFGLKVPGLEEDDTIEAYFQKVEAQVVAHHPRWRIRRFVTIGHFAFARLVMYTDLDPERWPPEKRMHRHRSLSGLLGGSNEGGGTSGEPHEVDSPKVTPYVPLLITDADSSQMSAIVDVMQGRDLAIEGPPGTGKSQTITNIIGGALGKGKRVLFMAEKMAALEVVKSRLDDAGLGDFALELHSTKAKKKEVLEGLNTRMQLTGKLRAPRDLEEARESLIRQRDQLSRYVALMNKSFGKLGMTVQQILWAEQKTRETENLPEAAESVPLEGVLDLTPYALQDDRDLLAILEKHARDFHDRWGSIRAHPWHGVGRGGMSPFDREALTRAVRGWRSALNDIHGLAARVPGTLPSLSTVKVVAAAKGRLPRLADLGDPAVFARMAEPAARSAARALASAQIRSVKAEGPLAECAEDPDRLFGSVEELRAVAAEGHRLGVAGCDAAATTLEAGDQRAKVECWTKAAGVARELMRTVSLNCPKTPPCLRLLIRAARLCAGVERQTLKMRGPGLMAEGALDAIRRGERAQVALRSRRDDLNGRFRLPVSQSTSDLRSAAIALRNAGLFGGLRSSVRGAKRLYAAICREPNKTGRKQMATDLEALASLFDDAQTFANEEHLKRVTDGRFDGIDCDMGALGTVAAFAECVRRDFAGLSDVPTAVREVLLDGRQELLDALIALAQPGRLASLEDAIAALSDPQDGDLAEAARALADRADALDQLSHTMRSLGLKASATPTQAGALAVAVEEARHARRELAEAEAEARRLSIDPEGKLPGRPERLRLAAAAADAVDALGLASTLRGHLFAADYERACAEIEGFAEEGKALLARLDAAVEAACSASLLDLTAFFGVHPDQIAIADAITRIDRALAEPDGLSSWTAWLQTHARASERGPRALIEALHAQRLPLDNLPAAYGRQVMRSLAREIWRANPELSTHNGIALDEARRRFADLDKRCILLEREQLRAILASQKIPAGNAEGRARDRTEQALIRAELHKKTKHVPIRDLLNRAGRAIQALKPCFMMSPLSVAQYLQPAGIEFDLVVIDEASQMKPEEALGGLARAAQVVVVGDPKQLPPTSFFDRLSDADEEDEDAAEADAVESILEMAMRCWHPYRRLLWHYRSRHGGLIAFSNEKFYDKELIVFPTPYSERSDFGVKLEHTASGRYKANMNILEAQAVAEAAVKFMCEHPRRSLGIVAMNKKQTELIQGEIDRLVTREPAAWQYVSSWSSGGNGLNSFFVKNLENVQGDERDVIFISVTYGPDQETGAVMQRFGPINSEVGWRRLNVLFTRAREQVRVFSSMRASDIRVDDTVASSRGRRALRDYLEYAATGRLHGGMGRGEPDNDFEAVIMRRLRARGFELDCQVGVAGYFIDLGVKHASYPDGYLAGIECDGAAYHSARSARDRDRLRQEVLEKLGWSILRIWSTDWFADPDGETDKVERRLRELLRKKGVAP